MRHPLITPLASRDGSVDKDEKLVNCYGEQDPITKETFVFKRAGIDEGDAVITGNDFYGQGAFSYGDDLFVIIDDILFKWDYVGGLDYGGDWVYVFGSQSGAGGAGGGGYYVEGNTQDYDISVTYDVGDSVIYDGVKYYNHIAGSGVAPGSNAYTWQTTPPEGNYYATFAGSTGSVCGSKSAAGYSASLLYPYNSYGNRHPSSNAWAVFAYILGNDVMAHQYVDMTSMGIADYGNVTAI